MKKIVFGLIALAMMGLSVVSCDDDDDDRPLVYEEVGDILPGTNNQIIIMDSGDSILITNKEKLSGVNYSRIMILCELMSEVKNGEHKKYEVRVLDYQKVLTKTPVLQSFINEDKENREDSIGHDRIHIIDSEIASKYLNILYSYVRSNPNAIHFINLVIDDTKGFNVENGELVINAELRHNAYQDNLQLSKSFVSFNIEEYMNRDDVQKITMNIKNGTNDIKIVKWEKKITPPVPTPLRSGRYATESSLNR